MRDRQVLQSGPGLLVGMSNDTAQLGKSLALFDDTTPICWVNLDEAHPSKVINDEIFPGIEINRVFKTCLCIYTDGEADILLAMKEIRHPFSV